MTGIFILLASLGGIIFLAGKWKTLYEAKQISTGWVVTILLLPLGDLMFLVRYWEIARSGVIAMAIGLAFISPLGMKVLYENRTREFERMRTVGAETREEARLAGENTASAQELYLEKQEKVIALNARIAAWYTELQAKQQAVSGATPEQIAEYNLEAAAYQSLLDVSRQEIADMIVLKQKATPPSPPSPEQARAQQKPPSTASQRSASQR